MNLPEYDALIGFGKPASKLADWIANTYIKNASVADRVSLENAIAEVIIKAYGKIPNTHS